MINNGAIIYFKCIVILFWISWQACKTTGESGNEKTVPVEMKKEAVTVVIDPGNKELRKVMSLPEELHECSGMARLGNNVLVANNDSGGSTSLYVFDDDGNGEVRSVLVKNVKNYDWEELTSDDQFLYIGDFGNNGGKRKNLMIYKIRKDELLTKTEVVPELIAFSYEGQTKFEDSNRHNFDCEAMISKGDSLFLFSKNRGDFRTDVYGLPKTPGEYVTRVMGSYDSDGLITGADYRNSGSNGELVLLGYEVHGKALYPFILHFTNVVGSRFLDGDVHRTVFREVLQTETILFKDGNKVLITNEEEDGSEGFIYEAAL